MTDAARLDGLCTVGNPFNITDRISGTTTLSHYKVVKQRADFTPVVIKAISNFGKDGTADRTGVGDYDSGAGLNNPNSTCKPLCAYQERMPVAPPHWQFPAFPKTDMLFKDDNGRALASLRRFPDKCRPNQQSVLIYDRKRVLAVGTADLAAVASTLCIVGPAQFGGLETTVSNVCECGLPFDPSSDFCPNPGFMCNVQQISEEPVHSTVFTEAAHDLPFTVPAPCSKYPGGSEPPIWEFWRRLSRFDIEPIIRPALGDPGWWWWQRPSNTKIAASVYHAFSNGKTEHHVAARLMVTDEDLYNLVFKGRNKIIRATNQITIKLDYFPENERDKRDIAFLRGAIARVYSDADLDTCHRLYRLRMKDAWYSPGIEVIVATNPATSFSATYAACSAAVAVSATLLATAALHNCADFTAPNGISRDGQTGLAFKAAKATGECTMLLQSFNGTSYQNVWSNSPKLSRSMCPTEGFLNAAVAEEWFKATADETRVVKVDAIPESNLLAVRVYGTGTDTAPSTRGLSTKVTAFIEALKQLDGAPNKIIEASKIDVEKTEFENENPVFMESVNDLLPKLLNIQEIEKSFNTATDPTILLPDGAEVRQGEPAAYTQHQGQLTISPSVCAHVFWDLIKAPTFKKGTVVNWDSYLKGSALTPFQLDTTPSNDDTTPATMTPYSAVLDSSALDADKKFYDRIVPTLMDKWPLSDLPGSDFSETLAKMNSDQFNALLTLDKYLLFLDDSEKLSDSARKALTKLQMADMESFGVMQEVTSAKVADAFTAKRVLRNSGIDVSALTENLYARRLAMRPNKACDAVTVTQQFVTTGGELEAGDHVLYNGELVEIQTILAGSESLSGFFPDLKLKNKEYADGKPVRFGEIKYHGYVKGNVEHNMDYFLASRAASSSATGEKVSLDFTAKIAAEQTIVGTFSSDVDWKTVKDYRKFATIARDNIPSNPNAALKTARAALETARAARTSITNTNDAINKAIETATAYLDGNESASWETVKDTISTDLNINGLADNTYKPIARSIVTARIAAKWENQDGVYHKARVRGKPPADGTPPNVPMEGLEIIGNDAIEFWKTFWKSIRDKPPGGFYRTKHSFAKNVRDKAFDPSSPKSPAPPLGLYVHRYDSANKKWFPGKLYDKNKLNNNQYDGSDITENDEISFNGNYDTRGKLSAAINKAAQFAKVKRARDQLLTNAATRRNSMSAWFSDTVVTSESPVSEFIDLFRKIEKARTEIVDALSSAFIVIPTAKAPATFELQTTNGITLEWDGVTRGALSVAGESKSIQSFTSSKNEGQPTEFNLVWAKEGDTTAFHVPLPHDDKLAAYLTYATTGPTPYIQIPFQGSIDNFPPFKFNNFGVKLVSPDSHISTDITRRPPRAPVCISTCDAANGADIDAVKRNLASAPVGHSIVVCSKGTEYMLTRVNTPVSINTRTEASVVVTHIGIKNAAAGTVEEYDVSIDPIELADATRRWKEEYADKGVLVIDSFGEVVPAAPIINDALPQGVYVVPPPSLTFPVDDNKNYRVRGLSYQGNHATAPMESNEVVGRILFAAITYGEFTEPIDAELENFKALVKGKTINEIYGSNEFKTWFEKQKATRPRDSDYQTNLNRITVTTPTAPSQLTTGDSHFTSSAATNALGGRLVQVWQRPNGSGREVDRFFVLQHPLGLVSSETSDPALLPNPFYNKHPQVHIATSKLTTRTSIPEELSDGIKSGIVAKTGGTVTTSLDFYVYDVEISAASLDDKVLDNIIVVDTLSVKVRLLRTAWTKPTDSSTHVRYEVWDVTAIPVATAAGDLFDEHRALLAKYATFAFWKNAGVTIENGTDEVMRAKATAIEQYLLKNTSLGGIFSEVLTLAATPITAQNVKVFQAAVDFAESAVQKTKDANDGSVIKLLCSSYAASLLTEPSSFHAQYQSSVQQYEKDRYVTGTHVTPSVGLKHEFEADLTTWDSWLSIVSPATAMMIVMQGAALIKSLGVSFVGGGVSYAPVDNRSPSNLALNALAAVASVIGFHSVTPAFSGGMALLEMAAMEVVAKLIFFHTAQNTHATISLSGTSTQPIPYTRGLARAEVGIYQFDDPETKKAYTQKSLSNKLACSISGHSIIPPI